MMSIVKPHLILVRHSITRQDPSVSSHEWTLSQEGRQRCQTLAEQLRVYQPDIIVTSPEPKATLTSKLIAATLSIPIETEADLREHQREHAPYLASQKEFEATIHRLLRNPDELVFGEETGTEARIRFQQAIDRTLRRHPDKTVIATTHGTVMSLFLGHVTDLDIVDFWQKLGMPGYVVLELPDYKISNIVYEVTDDY
jgi:broad specificity phosphatase PhoE